MTRAPRPTITVTYTRTPDPMIQASFGAWVRQEAALRGLYVPTPEEIAAVTVQSREASHAAD